MDAFQTSQAIPSPSPVEILDDAGYESALANALEVPAVAPLDASIHGVGVRLYSNHPPWRQFWSANWFAAGQWATSTGATVGKPRVNVYALGARTKGLPWIGYHREQNAAFLVGDVPYGALRALALAAVARLLADEQAVHFLPGAYLTADVETSGENPLGTLGISGTDLAVTLPALMERDNIRICALDGVFVRYGLVRMVDGVTLLPTRVINEKGTVVPGYHLFPWLDEYGYSEPRADACCLTMEGEEEYCFARSLDLDRAPEAFAFPLEQAWYIPTQIVAAHPDLIGALWPHPGSAESVEAERPTGSCELENVPPLTAELFERHSAWASEAIASLTATASPATESLLREIGQENVLKALCRLRANPYARAMVLPEHLWPDRAGGHPWRPIQIERLAPDLIAGKTCSEPEIGLERLIGRNPAPLAGENHEIARVLTAVLMRALQID